MAIHLFIGQFYGFCGSRTTQFPSTNTKVHVANLKSTFLHFTFVSFSFFSDSSNHALLQDPCHNGSHLASTYSALAILKIVGYDVVSIDSKALLSSMKKLQQPDGRYA